jgi:NADH-quinone oxidoreductase subunit M
MYQKVFFGPLANPKNQHLRDASPREIFVFLPIVLGIFVMGLFPRPFLAPMERSIARLRADFVAKLDDSNAHPNEVHLFGAAPPAATAPKAPVPERTP